MGQSPRPRSFGIQILSYGTCGAARQTHLIGEGRAG
jgi:hypothetical protein